MTGGAVVYLLRWWMTSPGGMRPSRSIPTRGSLELRFPAPLGHLEPRAMATIQDGAPGHQEIPLRHLADPAQQPVGAAAGPSSSTAPADGSSRPARMSY